MAKRVKQSPAAKKSSPSDSRASRSLLERSSANVVNAATTMIGRTLSGAEDVGREVGVTAIAAVRGSMQAAGQIGGDLVDVTKAAVEGTLDAAERIGTAATRAVRNIVSPDGGATRRSAPTTGPRRRRRQRSKMKSSLKAVKSSPRATEAAS